jgi:hypothetical protein
MNILSKLFGTEEIIPKDGDGLSQEEREGLIDLLLLSSYMDNNLSFAEDRVLKKEVEGFQWDSGTAIDLYIDVATNKIRRALADSQKEKELLKSLKVRITSRQGKEKALESMTTLFHSDGEDDKEQQFKETIVTLFK